MAHKLVARVPVVELSARAKLRVDYPPFHVLLVEVGGEPYAIDDTCNHAGESLTKGALDGAVITCPAHGYRFDVRTGCLLAPARGCGHQRTFEVVKDADMLVVYDDAPDIRVPDRT